MNKYYSATDAVPCKCGELPATYRTGQYYSITCVNSECKLCGVELGRYQDWESAIIMWNETSHD